MRGQGFTLFRMVRWRRHRMSRLVTRLFEVLAGIAILVSGFAGCEYHYLSGPPPVGWSAPGAPAPSRPQDVKTDAVERTGSEPAGDSFDTDPAVRSSSYLTPHRPFDRYPVRLHLVHGCKTPGGKYCAKDLSASLLEKAHEIADSIDLDLNIAGYNAARNDEYRRFVQGHPQWPVYGRVFAGMMFRSDQVLDPATAMDKINRQVITALGTDAPLADWAMEIRWEANRPGLAATRDPLLNKYYSWHKDDTPPYNYPFEVVPASGIEEGKEFQLSAFCHPRYRGPTEKDDNGRPVPICSNAYESEINDLFDAVNPPHPNRCSKLRSFAVVEGTHIYGARERAYYRLAPFENRRHPFAESFWEIAEPVPVQDVACFTMDPSKPEAPRVWSDSLKEAAGDFGLKGIITDNYGYSFNDPLTMEPNRPNTFTKTLAVPWRDDRGWKYLLGIGYNVATSHFRPAFDARPDPKGSYNRAVRSFTEAMRRLMSDSGIAWLPNLNSVHHLLLEEGGDFLGNLRWALQNLGPGLWDEKWGVNKPVETFDRRRRVLHELFLAREMSRNDRPFVLSALFYNYNEHFDSDRALGSPAAFAMEAALARYLLVLDKPSLKLHPYRDALGAEDKSSDSYWTLNNTTRILDPAHPTWIRTVLDVEAGRPLMESSGIVADEGRRSAVVFRQYENALALLNFSDNPVRVVVPERHCTDCAGTYWRLRIKKWEGRDRYDATPIPMSCPIDRLLDREAFRSCQSGQVAACDAICVPADSERAEAIADRVAYEPGRTVLLPAGGSVLLLNEEALPWETLRLETAGVPSEEAPGNPTFRVLREGYRDFFVAEDLPEFMW